MRVFVTGSSGVLGRATIRQLSARGHAVVALVRGEEKARAVSELDAKPVVGDIFDLEFLRRAMNGSDVVMHLASAIPKKPRPAVEDWAMNDRLRREGTRNLIEAARGEKLHAYVQQSVAFLYGDRRGDWVTEDEAPRPSARLQSAVEGEQMTLAAYGEFGLPGVILRGARFYGPEVWSTRNLIAGIKRHLAPVIGSGNQYWHYVFVEDMARACVHAAENPAPGEIFFVADDWPFHARDFLNYLAAQLKAPVPFKMTVTLARLLVGDEALFSAQSVRYRTDKIKKILGWTPRYPTFREGLAEILPQLGVSQQLP
jgi:nucleoside-diphosphate-sugar epimerase